MENKAKNIDEYIAKTSHFAKPILNHLRNLVHKGNPEVTETIKWGMPSFDYKGAYCTMAAFKHHAVFGFWKSKLLKDPKNYLGERFNQGGTAMGNMGRITSLKNLPPDSAIIDFIKQAKQLNDDGVKLPVKPKKTTTELVIPDYFKDAIKKNKKAYSVFENFSPSHKKEYVEWIIEAKREETRTKRLKTAVEWLSEGKVKEWRYVKK